MRTNAHLPVYTMGYDFSGRRIQAFCHRKLWIFLNSFRIENL